MVGHHTSTQIKTLRLQKRSSWALLFCCTPIMQLHLSQLQLNSSHPASITWFQDDPPVSFRKRTRHLEELIHPLVKQVFILRDISNPKDLWKNSQLIIEGIYTTNLIYIGRSFVRQTSPTQKGVYVDKDNLSSCLWDLGN